MTTESQTPGDNPLRTDVLPLDFGPGWMPLPPPRPKFQHRYRTHIILFVLTVLSTTIAGSSNYLGFQVSAGVVAPEDYTLSMLLSAWSLLGGFLSYSVPALLILGLHEFGHYAYCRRYNVDATLPYFLPAPPPFWFGTLGAVIRIREPFPSKKALFDIGIAGPIAGFIVMLPFLYLGLAWSQPVAFTATQEVIYFGEPVLLKALAWLQFGDLPDGMDIILHPVGFAAWFGMLATALNLLPFGQLDGGHISYAVFGRRAPLVSLATLGAAVLLVFHSASWWFFAGMLALMTYYFGLRHPPVADEHVPLDSRRKALALFALIMFVLCFTPTPISFGE